MRPTPIIALALLVPTLPAASAAVFRVNHAAPPGGDGQSWATAYSDLQTALAVAQPGDEIRVAQGVYRPGPPGSPRTTAFVIPPQVKVKGGYLAIDGGQEVRNIRLFETVLSGDLNGDDAPGFVNRTENAYNVVRMTTNDTSTETLLEGFTIRSGHSDDNFNIDANGGGGVRSNNFSGVIRDCFFTDNHGVSAGAIQASNGGYINNPRPRIERCYFVGNYANTQGSVGGGALYLGNSRADVVSCVFLANYCTNRGGAVTASGPISDSNIVNCTFLGNVAPGGGAAIYNNASVITVDNSIFWRNESSPGTGLPRELYQIWWISTNTTIVRNSTVDGLSVFAGNGNTGDDPLFVDPIGPDATPGTGDEDVRLSGASPAWNAGDNSALPPGSTRDILGNARIHAGIVDRGAYERDSSAPFCQGDFDGDGQVGSSDLATLLGTFGLTVEPPAGILTDLNGDNTINSADLAILLGSWGACP